MTCTTGKEETILDDKGLYLKNPIRPKLARTRLKYVLETRIMILKIRTGCYAEQYKHESKGDKESANRRTSTMNTLLGNFNCCRSIKMRSHRELINH